MNIAERFLLSRYTIAFVLLIHFIVWFTVFTALDIHPDMADHWIWSRHLSFGYYEHPPFIALTMRVITLLFSDIVFGLKLGSVLFSVLILYLGYLAARQFFDRRTALIFVLILESTPYFSTGSVFWHIDQPYMAFWLLGIFSIGKYINTRNPNWMLLFGGMAGLGALSKYIMILLPMGMMAWLVFNRSSRKLLVQWQTYLGALIALAIVAPNIYWNAQNDWITFSFVLDKGLKGASFGVHFMHFITSQFFLFSIIYSVYFWWQLFSKNLSASILEDENKAIAEQKWSFLLFSGLVPFLFFTLTSFMGSRTDPHWVNVAYFSFFMLLARFISILFSQGHIGQQIILFFSSIGINAVLLTVVLLQIHYVFIPYQFPDAPSLKVMTGWSRTAEQIKGLCEERNLKPPDYIISREYQLSSALGLYMAHHPWPHSIEKEERNLWSPVNSIRKEGALIVCPPSECRDLLEDSRQRFERPFRYLGEIQTLHNGKVLRKLKLFHLQPR